MNDKPLFPPPISKKVPGEDMAIFTLTIMAVATIGLAVWKAVDIISWIFK